MRITAPLTLAAQRETRSEKALPVIDGVAQELGALMLLSSLFIPERSTEHWYLIGANDVRLSRTRIATVCGMGARGRFKKIA